MRRADHYIRTGKPREKREIQLFDCLLIDAGTADNMPSAFELGD
ncbi:hypothetical protein [Alloyangia pacifica]|nr:hypothetical protein [Alloyangia pacifica]